MKQKEEKVASEVPTEQKWKASVPVYLTMEFTGEKKDREATVQQVLVALQLVTKVNVSKLGEPIFEEVE